MRSFDLRELADLACSLDAMFVDATRAVTLAVEARAFGPIAHDPYGSCPNLEDMPRREVRLSQFTALAIEACHVCLAPGGLRTGAVARELLAASSNENLLTRDSVQNLESTSIDVPLTDREARLVLERAFWQSATPTDSSQAARVWSAWFDRPSAHLVAASVEALGALRPDPSRRWLVSWMAGLPLWTSPVSLVTLVSGGMATFVPTSNPHEVPVAVVSSSPPHPTLAYGEGPPSLSSVELPVGLADADAAELCREAARLTGMFHADQFRGDYPAAELALGLSMA